MIEPDVNHVEYQAVQTDQICILYFISQKEYNRLTGSQVELEKGQAMVCQSQGNLKADSIHIDDLHLDIVGDADAALDVGHENVSALISASASNVSVVSSLMLIISDERELAPLEKLTDDRGELMLNMRWYYGYDLALDEESLISLYKEMQNVLIKELTEIEQRHGLENEGMSYSGGCLAMEKTDFFVTFGSLFFVGIVLSIVFIFAAAMIIYYKQLSEGYEDQSRFGIMKKVGMTQGDIKKSINSQILTVFFAPLLFAGLHLAFAFPLVWKILQLFYLNNLKLVIGVTVGAFVVFGIFYAVIYKLTARAYYHIVNE